MDRAQRTRQPGHECRERSVGEPVRLRAHRDDLDGAQSQVEGVEQAGVEIHALRRNRQHAVEQDVGTFAPGTAVSQTFRDNGKGMVFSARPTPNDGSVICTVLSATFADGTTYTAPPAPAASPSP